MKRILSFLSAILLVTGSLRAQTGVGKLFVSMPDSLLPLIPPTVRDAIVHTYTGEAGTTHTDGFGQPVRLDTLTHDYLRLTTSESSRLELRLLQTADSVTLIAAVTTVQAPQADSHIRFFNSQWQPLYWLEFPVPEVGAFLDEAAGSMAAGLPRICQALAELPLIGIEAQPEAPRFTLTLSPDLLDREQKKVAKPLLRPVTMEWNGEAFVRAASEEK